MIEAFLDLYSKEMKFATEIEYVTQTRAVHASTRSHMWHEEEEEEEEEQEACERYHHLW
jgi:predicted ATPase